MKAVIYARVSSTTDRQSTEYQVENLRDYAEKNGMQIIREFSEHISGAKKNSERPALCECLDFCLKGNAEIILITELSRLGRNVDEVLENVKRCKDNGINIYFQKEKLRIFQEDGKESPFLSIFISVLGTCAQMERENIVFRLNAGREKYISDGGKLGRKVGSVKKQDQLEKEYRNVIRELKKGTSVRRTAKLCDVSVSTVQRIKKAFNL